VRIVRNMVNSELHEIVDRAVSQSGHDALGGVKQLREQFAWLERRAVQRARLDGLNWAEIGRVLGMSRQSASERFSALLRTSPLEQMTTTRVNRDEAFLRLLNRKPTRPSDDDPVAW
jgi:AraC-like DNA-binding protein